MRSPGSMDIILEEGSKKAQSIATETLNRVRKSLGYH